MDRNADAQRRRPHASRCIVKEEDKFRQSFIVVRFKAGSRMCWQMDPSRLSIAIQADERFQIMKENFLYEKLGLTDFSDDDLAQLLPTCGLAGEATLARLLQIKKDAEINTDGQQQRGSAQTLASRRSEEDAELGSCDDMLKEIRE